MELVCVHGVRGSGGGGTGREVGSVDAYHAQPLCCNPFSRFWKKLNSTRITDSIFGSHFHDKAIVPLLPTLLLFINVGKRGYKKGLAKGLANTDLGTTTYHQQGYPKILNMGRVSVR